MSEQPIEVAPTLDYAGAGALQYDTEIVRRRQTLITPTRVALPPVCIKTGQSEDLVEKQWTLIWYPPLIILALFLPFGIAIVLILYLVMRKKGEVRFHVQRQFIARRRKWVVVGLAILAIGIGLGVWAGEQGQYDLIVVAAVIGLGSLFCMAFGGRLLYPGRITKTEMRLRGFGEPFLEQFPAVA